MKRQLISLMIILPLLSLFFSLEIYAQGGDPSLTGVKPTPAAKDSKSPSTGAVTPILSIGREKDGKLDPKTSKKIASGGFFEDLLLNNAKSEDLLSFRIESGNPSLGLQILGKNKAEVAVARDPSGDFKINTPTGGLPADGDYWIRVTGAFGGRNAVPFTIKVNRLGLTTVAYVERYRKIDANYRKDDPASAEETVAKLEDLGKADPSRALTIERLSRIHLEDRKDAAKAGAAMERAIKAKGEVNIGISFDNKWRTMSKSRSGDYNFQDKRVGQIKIQAGQLTLPDPSNKKPVILTGQQIRELTKTLVATYTLVTITADNNRRPYVFAAETMQQAEADLVIKLIQNHVMGKAN
ncbi:MAG: hypothetical protein ACREA2_24255 [Blastocatellia bacterium]